MGARLGPGRDGGAGLRPHRAWTLALVALLAAAGTAGFAGLGVWQLQRRVWKLELIAEVNARVRAPPIAAPNPAAWVRVTAARDAYRHVRLRGVFDHARETRVQALTDLGAGFWVVTPLRADAGFTVLVNRGFTPSDRADPATRRAGEVAVPVVVTGLLRLTEPRGSPFERNDPGRGLWYSRDVAAIAGARGLRDAAPYFIDADAAPNPGGWPQGGLTVVAFPNSHLVYAGTWFLLALMVAAASVFVAREEVRARRAARVSAGAAGR